MEKIDITSELERLDKHLAGNKRTILSAKFGDGKSYFLNEYVRTRGNEKLFITLHPVNYMVAPNEDIFEYIKRDVLKELCMYNLVTDDVLKKILSGVVNKDNAWAAVGFLAQVLLPVGMGKATKDLLKDFVTNYKKNEMSVQSYFSGFTNQRGGIYEEDAYTLMIKETILHVQSRVDNPKQVVLIIEDLDRIDPGHLFRILNVLGAHIDVEPDKNKFGFDNIILVLDYDVTRSIFHHFYGDDANYEGYMAKFKSSHVFRFSITRLAQQLLMTKMRILAGDGILKVLVMGRHSAMNSLSILDKIRQLSVRKVEHIMDRIDTMVPEYVERKDGLKLKARVPLTYLVALLVLMDDSYSRASIMETFEGENWLRNLGPLVYMKDSVEHYPISLGTSYCQVNLSRESGPVVDALDWNICYPTSEEQKHAIRRTEIVDFVFDYAMAIVADAQGIKFVIG